MQRRTYIEEIQYLIVIPLPLPLPRSLSFPLLSLSHLLSFHPFLLPFLFFSVARRMGQEYSRGEADKGYGTQCQGVVDDIAGISGGCHHWVHLSTLFHRLWKSS